MDGITLSVGTHDSPESGLCLLEAVAYVTHEPFSDHPSCVSPVLAAFGRCWNDDLDNETRQRLTAYIPRLVGTAGDDAADARRAWMATDWLARSFAPAWLRLINLGGHADELAALPEIASDESATSALDTLKRAQSAAEAALSAAWSAAESAAWSAAWSAAESAARSAARSALEPTLRALQESAFGLLGRMVKAVGVEATAAQP